MKSIIRRTKVQQLTGLSGSTIYRKYKAGDFPEPVRLGANSVGWYEDEVAAWIQSRLRSTCTTSEFQR
jgi:prophage regulatory protein